MALCKIQLSYSALHFFDVLKTPKSVFYCSTDVPFLLKSIIVFDLLLGYLALVHPTGIEQGWRGSARH
jgi:hypothetical protein